MTRDSIRQPRSHPAPTNRTSNLRPRKEGHLTTAAPIWQSWKGIPSQTLQRFGVSEGIIGWRVPYYDRQGALYRLKLFPFEGEECSSGPARWLGKSKPQIPYGAWRLAKADRKLIILTEGESDTLALATYLPRICALGVPGSNAWKPGWAGVLREFDRVFLSFDGDKPGRDLADRVLAEVPQARTVLLPDGADTRALLQALGTDAYVSLLHAAEATRRVSYAIDGSAVALSTARRVCAEWEAA